MSTQTSFTEGSGPSVRATCSLPLVVLELLSFLEQELKNKIAPIKHKIKNNLHFFMSAFLN
jgi:hypothetical protein